MFIERYLNRITRSRIQSRSYKIFLFDSRNFAFIEPVYKQDSDIHPFSTYSLHKFIVYIQKHIVYILILSSKKETFYHRRYAYNNWVENDFTSTTKIKCICFVSFDLSYILWLLEVISFVSNISAQRENFEHHCKSCFKNFLIM